MGTTLRVGDQEKGQRGRGANGVTGCMAGQQAGAALAPRREARRLVATSRRKTRRRWTRNPSDGRVGAGAQSVLREWPTATSSCPVWATCRAARIWAFDARHCSASAKRRTAPNGSAARPGRSALAESNVVFPVIPVHFAADGTRRARLLNRRSAMQQSSSYKVGVTAATTRAHRWVSSVERSGGGAHSAANALFEKEVRRGLLTGRPRGHD